MAVEAEGVAVETGLTFEESLQSAAEGVVVDVRWKAWSEEEGVAVESGLGLTFEESLWSAAEGVVVDARWKAWPAEEGVAVE